MAEIKSNDEILLQNLIDAGCGNELTEKCLEACDETSQKKILSLLQNYRNQLLDDIHIKQDNLYCLDYLIHQLRK